MLSNNLEDTPAKRVFFYYFQCYVPQHFLYSQEYIDVFGLPTTGDVGIDREIAKATVPAELTIVQMAEMLDEGASITIADTADARRIYEYIHAHLTSWQRETEGLGAAPPPIEDLRKLDALATEVLKVASSHMDDPSLSSSAFVRGFATQKSRSLIGRPTVPKAPTATVREHQPISELIARREFTRRR